MKMKGEVEMVKTSLKLPVAIWRAARVRALDERREFQAVVADALTLYLKRPPKGERS